MGNDAFHDLFARMRNRRINRRRFVQGAAGAGLGAAAITAPRVIVPAGAQDSDPVVFWTTFTPPELDILKEMVEMFNAQSTGTQAELVQIPPAEVTDVTKLMTAVRGGTGPDVYHLDRFIVAQRAADGLLQDLTPFLGDAKLTDTYIAFAAAEATFNGAPYALPFDTDVRALYYNRTLLQSVGVDPAEFDAAEGPMLWSRVKEIANMLNVQDSNGNYTQMGFVPWVNQGWHYTYGFSWGGEFFDEASCQVTPDHPKIVEAFQWVYDYCNELDAQKVNAFGGPSMQSGFPAQQHPFIVGTLAMQITGDWVINQIETYKPDLDYGITYIPVPNEGDQSSTWAGGWSVVIPQGAKNPEGAFEFMNWFVGEQGQRYYTQESKHLPTIAALGQDASLYSERHLFFAQQLLPTAKNRPPLPVGALYWEQLTAAWQAIYLNTSEPADALAQVKETVNAQLEGFCPIEMG